MRKNGGCDAFTTLPLVSCRYLTVTASNSCSMTSYSIYDCSVVDYFTALGKQGHILLINGLTTIRLYRLQTRRTPANARLAACHDERQSNINAIPAVLNKKPLSIHALPRPRAMPMPCSFLSCSLTLLLLAAMLDTLSLLELSMLRRMLLELLRLRARRASSGSCGCRPLALAKRFRISVRLMTLLSLPDKLDPVMAVAEMAGATAPVPARCVGAVELTGVGPDTIPGRGVMGDGGTRDAGVSAGVGGPEEEGDGLSTTHMRCERVATSFATV
jgi:hypothetical protein